MKLIIVSGLSGSGKSIALDTLEDNGYYCIDNLPVELLEAFANQAATSTQRLYEKSAISIDSRNQSTSFTQFSSTLELLTSLAIDYEIFFLQARSSTLLKRFSETRRKHPLTSATQSLSDAIACERKLLEPVAQQASLLIDTTYTNVHQLRDFVRERVTSYQGGHLSLLFQSFGYKNGIPLDTDFVFDVRCLPNPHWEPRLRSLTGKDREVVDFLAESAMVSAYIDDIIAFLNRWLLRFEEENRKYLGIAIGCTGGQHRSVYVAEYLAKCFDSTRYNIHIRHRELN